jgi:SAM-dependent methyltransferase
MTGVGHLPDEDLDHAYLAVGAALKAGVLDSLGPSWRWEGKRALDFGCGAGRVLRHLLSEAEVAEIHGSDVSEEMVTWAAQNLCPPIAGVIVNGEDPPLPYPDDHFDLVMAFSVFTHLVENWSTWLLEMRRILKPDGILIATFLDSSCADLVSPLPWDEQRVGMSAVGYASPEALWPCVLHSHWWLREHWGRAFEIERMSPGVSTVDAEGNTVSTQGWLVLRPRGGELTPADLTREDPGDPRYEDMRRHQVELARAEARAIRDRYSSLEAEFRSLIAEIEKVGRSASWRLTAPLRGLKAAAQSARPRRNGARRTD